MGFESKLEELLETAEKSGREQLDSRLRSFVATMVEALTQGESSAWADFDREELVDDAQDAGEAAIWLDAVACTRKHLTAGAHLSDLDLGGDATPAETRAALAQLHQDEQLPASGFVYVLWSQSPEEFAYVGTAGSLAECRFSPRSAAAKALDEAQTVSLIAPKRGGKKQLSQLASSIIHLVRCKTEADPTFNEDVDADMPDSAAWQPISQLSDLLEDAGVLLFNRAQTGED